MHNLNNSNYLDYIKIKYKMHINYKDKAYDKRVENVEKFLEDTKDFFDIYYDKYFNVNLTSSDSLSIFNVISKIINKLADYLLTAEDVVYEGLHTESNFGKKILKELPLSSCNHYINDDEENSQNSLEGFINILKIKNQPQSIKVQRNHKNVYNITNGSGEFNNILEDYNKALIDITNKIKEPNSSLNRYTLTKIKKDILNDINDTINGYKSTVNINVNKLKNYYNLYQINDLKLNNLFDFDSTNISLDDVRAFRMLCVLQNNKIEYDNNIVELITDFKKILNKIYISKKGREILSYIKRGYTYDDIAKKINIQKSYISKIIKDIIINFKKYYNLEMIILEESNCMEG